MIKSFASEMMAVFAIIQISSGAKSNTDQISQIRVAIQMTLFHATITNNLLILRKTRILHLCYCQIQIRQTIKQIIQTIHKAIQTYSIKI